MSDQNPSAWPDPTAASGPPAPTPLPAPAPMPEPTVLEPGVPSFAPGQASPAYPAPEPVSAGYAPMDQPAGYAQPGYAEPGYAQPAYPTQQGYPAQPGYPPPASAVPGYGGTPGYAAPGYGVPGYGAPGYPAPGYVVAKPTNGLAIGSMVVSLVSVAGLCFYGLGGLLGIVGAILGHVARRQVLERDQNGEGMAKAGIIIGWIATALAVLVIGALILLFVLAANSDPGYSGEADF
ncbi:DUF4190 domain-containing protein [Luedemannella helvata]|uniref:DUF4190 domain-containing protein n=1 Tax=Luedemannella helvata TaxID=349315 RepID=A0ABP4X6Y7_9ACTN